MESFAYQEWLKSRSTHRIEFFHTPETPLDSGTAEILGTVALTGASADRAGQARFGFEIGSRIHHSVETILYYQNRIARDESDETLSLFAIADPNDVSLIADLTTRIIMARETAAHHDGRPMLITNLPIRSLNLGDFVNPSVQQVVEIAAAVCEVIHRTADLADTNLQTAAAFIAQYGPERAIDWLHGKIIHPEESMKIIYEEWLQDRAEHAHELFGDMHELGSLAASALHANLQGRLTPTERTAHQNLTNSVLAILKQHNLRASGPNGALFGIIRDDALQIVADVTRDVIMLWRRTRQRNRMYSSAWQTNKHLTFDTIALQSQEEPDFSAKEVQWAVETAAAVCEVLQAGYPYARNNETAYQHDYTHEHGIASLIAKRGPAFAREWLLGKPIKEYCRENKLDSTWLNLLSQNDLATVLLDNPRSPFIKVHTIANNFRMAFQTDTLQRHTGWEQSKIDYYFTPVTMASVMLQSPNAIQDIAGIATTLDTILAPRQLADTLGARPRDIQRFLPPWALVRMAQHPNPMALAQERLTLCHELISRYGVASELATFVAHNFPDTALQRAKQAARQSRPTGANATVWSLVVAKYPESGDPRRMQEMTANKMWRDYMTRTQPDYDVRSNSTITAAMSAGILHELAHRTGVSYRRLDSLLIQFGRRKMLPEITELQNRLEWLQQISA